ncbi:MAG: hypothetical protein PVG71_08555 [Anaerolineae bacterium]|jgi:hypothetical protein
MSSIIDRLFDQEVSVITLQVSILAVNAYVLLERAATLWSAASVIIIVCLFCLQVVSRRFLMFYPVRKDFNVPIPATTLMYSGMA